MTTEETITKNGVLKKDEEIGKIWQIEVAITNPMGVKAFSGKMLSQYKHPITGKTEFLKNPDGDILTGYVIEKPKKIIKPYESQQAMNDLLWLLAHPEVTVEGIDLNVNVKSKKRSTGIVLKNLDKQEIEAMDDEDFVDKIIGRISEDVGPKSLGVKKLRSLLAFFNLPYRDGRYLKNPKAEKKSLRSKLKSFVRAIDNDGTSPYYGKPNAYKFAEILEDVDNYEIYYQVKEMIRLGVITESHGYYRYNNVGIGTNIESMVNYLKNHLEVLEEMRLELVKNWKNEELELDNQ